MTSACQSTQTPSRSNIFPLPKYSTTVQRHTRRCPILGCCWYSLSHSFRDRLGRPVEGMRHLVPLGNKLHELRPQGGFRGKVDNPQTLALENREPLLHPVQPRTVHRREVQDQP